MPAFDGLRGRLLALAEATDSHVDPRVTRRLSGLADQVADTPREALPHLRPLVLSQGLTTLAGQPQPEDATLVLWDPVGDVDPWPWLLRDDHAARFALGSRLGVVVASSGAGRYLTRVDPWNRHQLVLLATLGDFVALTTEAEGLAAGLSWRAAPGRSGVAESRRLNAARDAVLTLANAYAAAAPDAANAYLADLTLLANRVQRDKQATPTAQPVRLRG